MSRRRKLIEEAAKEKLVLAKEALVATRAEIDSAALAAADHLARAGDVPPSIKYPPIFDKLPGILEEAILKAEAAHMRAEAKIKEALPREIDLPPILENLPAEVDVVGRTPMPAVDLGDEDRGFDPMPEPGMKMPVKPRVDDPLPPSPMPEILLPEFSDHLGRGIKHAIDKLPPEIEDRFKPVGVLPPELSDDIGRLIDDAMADVRDMVGKIDERPIDTLPPIDDAVLDVAVGHAIEKIDHDIRDYIEKTGMPEAVASVPDRVLTGFIASNMPTPLGLDEETSV